MIKKISLNIVQTCKTNLQRKASELKPKLVSYIDTFERTTNPLQRDIGLKTDIIGNISEQTKKSFEEKIQNFPEKWKQLFKENNYRVILTDDMSKACKQLGISDKVPREHITAFGLTYTDGNNSTNVFCFSGKTPLEHINKVVNHEFGHGVCNIKKLYSDKDCLNSLSQDTTSIIKERKLDNLTGEERNCISKYFFGAGANLPADEIIADIFAWQQNGGGCYGSEMTLNKANTNLMQYLFPALSNKIKTI